MALISQESKKQVPGSIFCSTGIAISDFFLKQAIYKQADDFVYIKITDFVPTFFIAGSYKN